MAINIDSGNKTVKGYWDGMWRSNTAVKNINPYGLGLKNYTIRMFHAYFEHVFASLDKRKSSLLEIGCANSTWLPYFSKEHGFDVSGLDYSEVGCDKARQNLRQGNISGKVVCADLFSPPIDMIGCYDVVVSFGVVEHFDDTSKCIDALLKYLKTGGLLLTNIPNMTGYVGFIQKYINRPIFDIHNPIDRKQFRNAHEAASIEVIECDYFMSTGFGICNLNGIKQKSISWLLKRVILALLVRVSMLIWIIESKFGALPAKQSFSPYVNCIARKS